MNPFAWNARSDPAKILQPDEPVALLTGREQHAVKRDIAPRLHHARQFIYEVAEVLEKFLVAAAVAHVSRAIAVGVEAGERGEKIE